MKLEDFKELAKSDKDFVDKILGTNSDVIDYDNGSMIIHRKNLMKYLEQWMCKSEDDLVDTLWYSHGVSVKIID